MEEIIETIQRVGFPIAMCMWFMFRTERVITKNTDAIKELTLHLKK